VTEKDKNFQETMHLPGEVPRYLDQRKVDIIAESQPPTPKGKPGMRLMTEEEKLLALEDLNERRAELEEILCRLPLQVETPSMMREKNLIESELGEVDASISQLQKKFVYVPID
jgi:hypothetical protein